MAVQKAANLGRRNTGAPVSKKSAKTSEKDQEVEDQAKTREDDNSGMDEEGDDEDDDDEDDDDSGNEEEDRGANKKKDVDEESFVHNEDNKIRSATFLA